MRRIHIAIALLLFTAMPSLASVGRTVAGDSSLLEANRKYGQTLDSAQIALQIANNAVLANAVAIDTFVSESDTHFQPTIVSYIVARAVDLPIYGLNVLGANLDITHTGTRIIVALVWLFVLVEINVIWRHGLGRYLDLLNDLPVSMLQMGATKFLLAFIIVALVVISHLILGLVQDVLKVTSFLFVTKFGGIVLSVFTAFYLVCLINKNVYNRIYGGGK